MSGQHTQGRLAARDEWLVPADQIERPIGGSSDKVKDHEHYANIITTVNGKYHDNRANARRLAACWNACDHLDTDHIESIAEVGVASVIVTADIHRKDREAVLRELAAARALLTEALASDDEAIADAEVVGLSFPAELTALTERIRAFLKGQP